MNFEIIIEIIFLILVVVAYIAALYFKTKGNIFGISCELIANAELTGLAGPDKMAHVVETLYTYIPAFLKAILTPEKLKIYAQGVFDWMRKYANAYLEAQKKDTPEEIETTTKDVYTNAVSDVLDELLTLSLAELKEKAAKYGINLENAATKKEIITEIVKVVIEKV